MEITEFCTPAGKPSRIIAFSIARSMRISLTFSLAGPSMRVSFTKLMIALTNWEMQVANAAPAMPKRSTLTNRMSSTTFSPAETIR